MFSFGLVCLHQERVMQDPPVGLTFDVVADAGVHSHRGDSPPFGAIFRLLSGCTYHVGTWHTPDYFSSWDYLVRLDELGPGHRQKVRVMDTVTADVAKLLEELLHQSPTRSALVFVDTQGLPASTQVVGPLSEDQFWSRHAKQGLVCGWLYHITGD